MFKTYTVGRSEDADIKIQHDTVSREHFEITHTDQGRYYLVDKNSTYGTYVWREDSWQSLQQGYIEPDECIALGKKKVRMQALIQQLRDCLADSKIEDNILYEPVSVKPRRSSETGEVLV